MKKSKTIFGVFASDIIEQIKIDSNKENKLVKVESNKQKIKTLLKKSKIMRHNTKKK